MSVLDDFVVKPRRFAAVALFLIVAGCSSALHWTPEYHVVQRGDTLYSIAFGYQLDQRDVAAWNGLGNGSVIYPGQKIRLTGPSGSDRQARSSGTRPARGASPTVRAKPPVPVSAWQWPTDGEVVAAYGSSSKTRSGMQIGGRRGQPVRAAAGGQVVYAGSGLVSYGQLLIIKHNQDYLSAYGHNDSLAVAEGDRVSIGQQIARMGLGPGPRPLLHFEIRRYGKPVNPLAYLPRR